jgi:hypothetical protein
LKYRNIEVKNSKYRNIEGRSIKIVEILKVDIEVEVFEVSKCRGRGFCIEMSKVYSVYSDYIQRPYRDRVGYGGQIPYGERDHKS